MKTAVLLALTILAAAPAALAQNRPEAPIRTTPFPDVPREHWAYDAVEQLRKVGIVRGYPPQQTFAPASPVPKTKKPAAPAGRRGRRR